MIDGSTSSLLSMTGFGRAERSLSGVQITVEIRTVNSRYLDVIVRAPREFQSAEAACRERVQGQLSRGRVEVTISRASQAGEEGPPSCNQELLDQFLSLGCEHAERLGLLSAALKKELFLQLLDRKDILERREIVGDFEHETPVMLDAVSEALQHVVKMRAAEGVRLSAELLERLTTIERYRDAIADATRTQAEQLRTKLQQRIQKVLADAPIDSNRLEMEVALLVDRADVSEELTRIESHAEQARAILQQSPVGRKLEFLLQEFSREFNTISSKVQYAEVQHMVVEAKAEIEKIREQVQNLE